MSHKGKAPAAPATTMPSTMTLEVRIVNGEDVRVPSGRPLCTACSSVPTSVDQDPDCHGYPYWDETVRVSLPFGARWLDVEICRAHAAAAGAGGAGGKAAETVAAARVPVEDFTVGPPGHLHCLSYRLFGSSCGIPRRNGIVNLTIRRIDGVAPLPRAEGKAVFAPAAPAGGKAAGGASGSGSCSGAAAVVQGKPAAPAGAVMGYPVGC